jgi:hypothetical protein
MKEDEKTEQTKRKRKKAYYSFRVGPVSEEWWDEGD